MQLATLQELSFDEIDQVSGAGLFSFVGDAIVDAVKVSNDLLNTSVISSVGRCSTPSADPHPSTGRHPSARRSGRRRGRRPARRRYQPYRLPLRHRVDLIPGPRPLRRGAVPVAGGLRPRRRPDPAPKATSAPIREPPCTTPSSKPTPSSTIPTRSPAACRAAASARVPRSARSAGGRLTPAFVIQPAEAAASSCPAPAGFPAGLELYRRAFRNWSGKSPPTTSGVAPRAPTKRLARAQNGRAHPPNWSPCCSGENCESRIVRKPAVT